MIRFSSAWYYLTAVLLLFLPLKWLLAAVFAAAIHEAGHLIVIAVVGSGVNGIRIDARGIRIDTIVMQTWQEWICAAAGPAASFSLLFLSHMFPRLSVCGVIQGVFNLLPVFPSDGGRMLRCILRWMIPGKADIISACLGLLVMGILLIGCLIAAFQWNVGIFPVILWCTMIFGMRKNALQNSQIRSTIGLPFTKR